MLRSGLCLIDTPGVGGLDSVHGQLTLGALDAADGDAVRHRRLPGTHRPRTRVPPDRRSQRCPAAAVVITKTDLYRTLATHRRARHADTSPRPASTSRCSRCRRSSGCARRNAPSSTRSRDSPPLVEFLATAVVVPGTNARGRDRRGPEVDFVATQTGAGVRRRAGRYSPKRRRAAPRWSPSSTKAQRSGGRARPRRRATWQQTLSDGVAGPGRRRRARPAGPAAHGAARRRGRSSIGRPEGHLGRHRGLAAPAGRRGRPWRTATC